MPIRSSEKAKYPPDWPAIRARILERAGNCCEFTMKTGERCSAPHGELIFRWLEDLESWRWPNGNDCGEADPEYRGVVVVLTIAHLDHNPANCTDDNLRAGCQLHHLRYDQHHHQRNATWTRRDKKGNAELFPEARG